MFGFIIKMFIRLLSACTIGSFCDPLLSNSEGRLKWISLNNRLCQTRPSLVNMNSNENIFIHLLLVLTLFRIAG